eukprot:SAG11_NODE_3831_length_2198_cov_5.342544_2_plen_207_part_00
MRRCRAAAPDSEEGRASRGGAKGARAAPRRAPFGVLVCAYAKKRNSEKSKKRAGHPSGRGAFSSWSTRSSSTARRSSASCRTSWCSLASRRSPRSTRCGKIARSPTTRSRSTTRAGGSGEGCREAEVSARSEISNPENLDPLTPLDPLDPLAPRSTRSARSTRPTRSTRPGAKVLYWCEPIGCNASQLSISMLLSFGKGRGVEFEG